MKQPIRNQKKPKYEVEGLEFCNDCPFLNKEDGRAFCNTYDVELKIVDGNIILPPWCGFKKKKDER